jgi:hypothetical protein
MNLEMRRYTNVKLGVLDNNQVDAKYFRGMMERTKNLQKHLVCSLKTLTTDAKKGEVILQVMRTTGTPTACCE